MQSSLLSAGHQQLPMRPETPNQALQRTAPAVTARASAAALPPAMHGPRQPPPSLSLGSLGASPPVMKTLTSFLLVLAATFAIAADSPNAPAEIYIAVFKAFQQAELLEKSKSIPDAIKNYREAEKLVKLLRDNHPNWKPDMVDLRAARIAAALKRLTPVTEPKKPE